MDLSRRAAFFGIGGGVLQAANWPRFRGENGAGLAVGSGVLPDRLSPKENVVWKTACLFGHSSPVVWGDRIFLTGAQGGSRTSAGRDKVVDEGGKLFTLCFDRKSGRELWRREVPRPRLERYQPTNSPASPTVATDGSAIYTFFGDFGLLAYSMDGKELWQRPLGPFNNVNGHGSSPMLAGNLVIMLCDQDTDSYLIAMDKKTGKTAWRVERPEVTRCYSTPGLYQAPGGVTELIIPGAYYLTSYDARTGRKLWWVRGFSWQPKSAVAISDGLIYAHGWEGGGEAETVPDTPTWEETKKRFDQDGDGKVSAAEFAPDERLARGMVNNDLNSDGFMDEREWENFRARRASRNSIMVVKPGGTGDVTKTHVLWQMQKFVPNVPSPLVYERILYLVKDGGILSAVDGPTGKMLKQGRLAGALDTYYSSPVGGDGKVYLLSQPGKSTIIRAGAEWEVIHQADMEEECYATPALVDGKIYLRTRGSLYCFGKA